MLAADADGWANPHTEKYLLALGCLLAAHHLDSSHPEIHYQIVSFAKAMTRSPAELDTKLKEVLQAEFASIATPGQDLGVYNEDFKSKHKDSAAHLHAAARVKYFLCGDCKPSTQDMIDSLHLDAISLADAQLGLRILEDWKAPSESIDMYRSSAREKWPEASVFQST